MNGKDGLTYAWIPPGKFIMGCSPGDFLCEPDEKPPHPVTLTKGFWMGQTPVTDGVYKAYIRSKKGAGDQDPAILEFFRKSFETPVDPQVPAIGMKWDDARKFCEWAGGRLPTEAEWEYAARAGTTGARYAKLESNPAGFDGPPRVKQKEKNPWNLYDMLGSVWHWTGDRYNSNYYKQSEERDPAGAASGQSRALRGVPWHNDAMPRVSDRSDRLASLGGSDIGFRCVLENLSPL